MSTYAIIALEHSGEIDNVPLALDPAQEFVYGQGFQRRWSILDSLAEKKGWQSLSSFCTLEGYDGNCSGDWHDAEVGLATVSGLLNLFFQLIGEGSVTLAPSDSPKMDSGVDLSNRFQDSTFLLKVLKSDPFFSNVLWDLRVYELLLRSAIANNECFRIHVS